MPFSDSVCAPNRLATAQFVLRPIAAADALLDYEAVMESRLSLRRWQQSSWPADDFTVDDNRRDVERMEQRHRAGEAFGYTVLSPDESECLGCVYVFAHDARFLAAADIVAVGEARWDQIDAAVYFWVRTSRLTPGLDHLLLMRLRCWFADDWGFGTVVFVTSEPFTEQVELIESTGLELRFQIVEPDKPGRFLAYA